MLRQTRQFWLWLASKGKRSRVPMRQLTAAVSPCLMPETNGWYLQKEEWGWSVWEFEKSKL